MSKLDEHVRELEKALYKVVKWPYKPERDQVLYELYSYVYEQLEREK